MAKRKLGDKQVALLIFLLCVLLVLSYFYVEIYWNWFLHNLFGWDVSEFEGLYWIS